MNDRSSAINADVANYLQLEADLASELENNLAYWLNNMQDVDHGGFYGRRLWNETLVRDAAKSAVLNARILWSFSAAAIKTSNNDYVEAAHRAYNYFTRHFIDDEFGGVYWSLTFEGKPLDTKKQVYAQSFAIYALAEYYRLTKKEEAKQLAISLYHLIEYYSNDRDKAGYLEAFTREWLEIEDVRLSEKDANEKKTMNTHLHVLEAYTNLFRIYPGENVRNSILELLHVFREHIINDDHHLVLFFDEYWNRKGMQVSYGHDIEAAWLLYEAAEIIEDDDWLLELKQLSIAMVDAALEGMDKDHGLWHEFDPSSGHKLAEKHWWPQAEAMVGLIHAWEVTQNEWYLQLLQQTWQFIKNHLIDKQHGEWIWGIHQDYSPITTEDKAGFWKGPYHNSRACLEVMSRLKQVTNMQTDNRQL